MSADNGIYILVTLECINGHFTGRNQYRVAECSAIDNIYTSNDVVIDKHDNKHFIYDLYRVILFGESNVYTSKYDAMVAASDIEDKIHKDGRFTEYGIVVIRDNNPFPEIKYQVAEKLLEKYYNRLR